MGIFEDVFLKVKSAATSAGEKAGQFIDVSKLQFKLTELKGQLKDEFKDLGKSVYNLEKKGENDGNLIKSYAERIDSLVIQIEDLKTEIALMKNKVVCKNCGKDNECESAYCSKCGKSITEMYEKAESERKEEEKDDFEDYEG